MQHEFKLSLLVATPARQHVLGSPYQLGTKPRALRRSFHLIYPSLDSEVPILQMRKMRRLQEAELAGNRASSGIQSLTWFCSRPLFSVSLPVRETPTS